MTTLRTEPESPAASRSEPRIRAIYRDGSGQIHTDWPADQIAEAVADREGVLWVDIEDHEAHLNAGVEALLTDVFGFHHLAIEDALEDRHVPKVDDWGDYLYLVFHSIDFDPESSDLRLHELDMFLGPNYLVSYHNQPLPLIDQTRRNIERDPDNRLRHGADHVLYHLLDLCVAEYLPAIEHLDDAIDDAQDEVFGRPTPRTLQAIFRVKRSTLRLHRVLSPQREVLNRLARDEYKPIRREHRVYFRDVYDQLVRIHDITESLRDLISGALDTYLSAIANRTNDIMKTLTLVSVMFLPMSFLVGFFGMNFFSDNLALPYRMPTMFLFASSCVIMFATPWAMWIWAKRRGWF
jgi:magnesium transporter